MTTSIVAAVLFVLILSAAFVAACAVASWVFTHMCCPEPPGLIRQEDYAISRTDEEAGYSTHETDSSGGEAEEVSPRGRLSVIPPPPDS